MLDLAILARRLRVRGRAIMLRDAQPQIQTLIELVGIHRLPGVVLESVRPAAQVTPGSIPVRAAII